VRPAPGRARRVRALAVGTLLALVAHACGSGGETFDAASRDPHTEEAEAWGLGPQPADGVTFQPDVVIVGGAGRSIRGVTDGGLTWHLDASAKGVDDLEPGKIMFVTGRSVGRVLALARDGDEVAVTIGPVTLTDVIRDGTFKRTDIDLSDPVEYPVVEPSWETTDVAVEAGAAEAERSATDAPDGSEATEGSEEPAEGDDEGAARDLSDLDALAPADPAGGAVPAAESTGFPGAGAAREGPALVGFASAAEPVTTAAPGSGFGSCCSTGIGAHFNHNKGGTKVSGTVELTFQRPDAGFYLSIKGGQVVRAELVVSGGFGAKVDFQAGIDGGQRAQRIPIPLSGEFGFPIAQVLGVPLTFTISQGLTVTTAFGASIGTITGSGSFDLGARFAFGYANGSFGNRSSTSFKTTESLVNDLGGMPVGVMGLLIRHRVRFNVGFSAYVLKAGVYMDVETAVGASRGSALGAVGTLGTHFVECQGVGLGIWTKFGIGYSIFEPVAKAINSFLSLLDIKPISFSGGLSSKPVKIYANEEVVPDVELCGHAGSGGPPGSGAPGGGTGKAA